MTYQTLTVEVSGAGEKAFVAGADISQLRDYTMQTGLDADQRTGQAPARVPGEVRT